jgi:hypothetical protein
MNPEDIHWSLLRPGDTFVTGNGEVVRVLAVTLTGWVWDTNGDAWQAVNPAGVVRRLRPVTQFAKDMDAMERYAAANRNIIIEVRG